LTHGGIELNFRKHASKRSITRNILFTIDRKQKKNFYYIDPKAFVHRKNDFILKHLKI